jgi:hypothetical protein
LVLALCATSAFSATVKDRPLGEVRFNGEDASAGSFTEPQDMAIDNSSGIVYVYDADLSDLSGGGAIDKFDVAGKAQGFTGLAGEPSSISGLNGNPVNGIAVDNSAAHPGRIYFSQFAPPRLRAFSPAGDPLWEVEPPFQPCDVAVDGEGHVWLAGALAEAVEEYDGEGNPLGGGFPLTNGSAAKCRIAYDAGNTLYVSTGERVDKYVGGIFAETLDPESNHNRNVAVDQSAPAGHVFTAHPSDFAEYEPPSAVLGSFGTSFLGGGPGFGEPSAQAIAYDPALDRIYVANQDSDEPRATAVLTFGALTEGTVPDATICSVLEFEVGISKATLCGSVNPHGVANSYYFEAKPTAAASWAGARRTAATSCEPQPPLPGDNADHEVSCKATGLEGNRAYQVRLVGVNTANGLKSYSNVEEFTTAIALPPSFEACPVLSETSASSIKVTCTIDPKEDTTHWQVETIERGGDPECKGPWSVRTPTEAEGNPIVFNETTGGVALEFTLSGLLPAESYCLRVSASNSGGTVHSGIKEEETLPVPPSDAETSFAGPRLDTSARLNGRINPQGAVLSFYFELSGDGGASWKALPKHTETSETREPIIVDSEIGDLQPNHSYIYRLRAENAAGPASPQGTEKTFITRTTEGVSLPAPRGIELINNPDKGNQNAQAVVMPSLDSAIAPSGERALWSVAAGAPGAATGSGDTFLAVRTPAGWESRTLLPPSAEQLGKGKFTYEREGATADFSRFIFRVGKSEPILGIFVGSPVRVGLDRNEEVLSGPNNYTHGIDDISTDGAHVVTIDPESGQLVDIGAGKAEVLSVMPNGVESACPLGESASKVHSFYSGPHQRPRYQWISAADASRAYFQVQPKGECVSGLKGLYERNREVGGKGKTTLIDPGPLGAGVDNSPEFIRAASDGRAAYFITFSNHGTLASIDPEGKDKNNHADIYRWDEKTGKSTCLTCIVPDANIPFSGAGGLVPALVSDDFSHVYFQSNRQLVSGQGKAGEGNIYSLSGGNLHFVADPDVSSGALRNGHARLSSDGNVLVFSSEGGTGANRILTADSIAPGAKRQLYLYDDRDGSLQCISCQPDAQTTESPSSLGETPPGGLVSQFALSSDGSTVAFRTAQALLPTDVNDAVDVYEWRNGVVRLITDGVSQFPRGLLTTPGVDGISANGRDIMFSAVAPRLTGFEHDSLANLYDARIGGGFTPLPLPAHCSEESCQGTLESPPPTVQAGSAIFSGSGNPIGRATSCRRRWVRRHGRCVKRHHQTHRRAAHADGGVK